MGWVIFPKLSFQAHRNIEKRNVELGDAFSEYGRNVVSRKIETRFGIATGGINYTYTMEALGDDAEKIAIFKVATPFPFPERKAVEYLEQLDAVLCVEELDPVIERALTYIAGKYHLPVKIYGKLTGHVAASGENTIDSVKDSITQFLLDQGIAADRYKALTAGEKNNQSEELAEMPELASPVSGSRRL